MNGTCQTVAARQAGGTLLAAPGYYRTTVAERLAFSAHPKTRPATRALLLRGPWLQHLPAPHFWAAGSFVKAASRPPELSSPTISINS